MGTQTQIVFSSVKLHSVKAVGNSLIILHIINCRTFLFYIYQYLQYKMARSNVLVAIFIVTVAANAAVDVQRDPFVRLIPADILRDYRSGCFASTQCKVFKPNETWPLTPFCGRARCVAFKVPSKTGGKDKIKLAEEVTDCGPVIDIEKTPDCELLADAYDVKEAFPTCCQVYDCAEGADITYVATKRNDEKGNRITANAAGN